MPEIEDMYYIDLIEFPELVPNVIVLELVQNPHTARINEVERARDHFVADRGLRDGLPQL